MLDRLGRRLVVGHLRENREVAEAAEDDASVGELLPVVETVSRVVRAREELFTQRFGRDNLAARGPERVVELRQESSPRSVCRDDNLFGVQVVERRHAVVLLKPDAFGVGERGKVTDEPARLQGAIRRMEDCAAELGTQMRELVAPLRGESVLVQRFVLQADVVALLVVGRKSKAAGAAEVISGDCFEPIESRFGALPQLLRRLGAVRLPRNVVPCCAAAKSKAAVAAAGALGDSARVVHAHTQPAARECERTGDAGDAGADNRDVDVLLRA